MIADRGVLLKELRKAQTKLDAADRVADRLARELKGLARTIATSRRQVHDIVAGLELGTFNPRFTKGEPWGDNFKNFQREKGSGT